MAGKRTFLALFAAQTILATAIVWGARMADRAYPPPLEAASERSREVLDRDGRLLRAFTTGHGKWRLAVKTKDVDPRLVNMLIAYEDQRFYDHHGLDLWAMARAGYQLVTNGHVVSGGSTISMQVARLIEPRRKRSVTAKLLQMARAVQIENRLSKAEILELYLNLAPYGGNLEGIRAASLAYFQKEPARLSAGQSALLVSLPQAPERRRPDRHPQAAEAGREKVLSRLSVSRAIGAEEILHAHRAKIQAKRFALPAFAPHLAYQAVGKFPGPDPVKTTLVKSVQKELEAIALKAARDIGPKISVAMVLADARTGSILAEVGSSDYMDNERRGWIDMSKNLRSPGSALKPFIYGLGFQQGLIAQQMLIEDRPADFSGYRPRNFDMSYQGDVTIRRALQLSLNIPAVRVLDAVGTTRLSVLFRKAGVEVKLPDNQPPGLAMALGGLGISLRDLVQLYAALANRGFGVRLGDGVLRMPAQIEGPPVLDSRAVWQITDILSGMRLPTGSPRRKIAYKTGTSYGYRDAWSVGYDGRYVLGVWVGRADNAAIPGISGFTTATPILFEAFSRSNLNAVRFPDAPYGTERLSESQLPASQKRFSFTKAGLVAIGTREAAPSIVYPPANAQIDLDLASADASPLQLKLQGGRPPFRWIANGLPVAQTVRRREYQWRPDGAGISTLTVIDAAGRAATVSVMLK